MPAVQEHDLVVLDGPRHAQFQGLDVLSVWQVCVELANEKSARRLAHEDVLRSFTRFKAVHMVDVDMRLDAHLVIAMKSIAADPVPEDDRPRGEHIDGISIVHGKTASARTSLIAASKSLPP